MTRSKPIQKFICWFERHPGDNSEIQAPDHETAAEWYVESEVPYSDVDEEYNVDVQAEDGTVYGVTVETVRTVRGRVRS